MSSSFILQILFYLTGILSLIALLIGFNLIQSGRKSPYYRIRQRRISDGWKALMISLVLGASAALISRFSAPFQNIARVAAEFSTATLTVTAPQIMETTQTPVFVPTDTQPASATALFTLTALSDGTGTPTLLAAASSSVSLTQTPLPWATSTITNNSGVVRLRFWHLII